MFWYIILFLLGIFLIVKGGDWFVDAASWIAKVSGINSFIIGATIVSVATTLPEMIVSVIAAVEGSSDMAIGNAVGSVTANLGLIMGVSMVCLPAVISRKDYAFKGILMVATCTLLYVFCLGGKLSIVPAVAVFLLFFVFIIENIHSAKRMQMLDKGALGTQTNNSLCDKVDTEYLSQQDTQVNAEATQSEDACKSDKAKKQFSKRQTIAINILKFILGAAGIVGGAQLLVTYGQKIALELKVPEIIVALTFVAIGTSLPELVTTLTAIAKKQSELSIGNIVGANIIDLAVILPVCAFIGANKGGLIINPEVVTQTLYLDFPVCLGLCLVAIVPMLIAGRYRRWQGITILSIYAGYIAVLCMGVF